MSKFDRRTSQKRLDYLYVSRPAFLLVPLFASPCHYAHLNPRARALFAGLAEVYHRFLAFNPYR